MRYGTRTELKRKWTPQKVRPQGKVKFGYQWGYLYAAVNPTEGKLYAYFMPDMRAVSLQAFLDEFAQDIEHQTTILIVDGATAHRSSLQLPDHITLRLLPAYSPELNPVERLFEELRKVLANRVYDDLQDVEQVIEDKLQQYWQKPYHLIQLTKWDWFYEDIHI